MIDITPAGMQRHTEQMEAIYASVEESRLKSAEVLDRCVKEMIENNAIMARALEANKNRTFIENVSQNIQQVFTVLNVCLQDTHEMLYRSISIRVDASPAFRDVPAQRLEEIKRALANAALAGYILGVCILTGLVIVAGAIIVASVL